MHVHVARTCVLPAGYFAHLSALNNILMMSQQLNSDLRTCASHKYIAHQTALLYVSGGGEEGGGREGGRGRGRGTSLFVV